MKPHFRSIGSPLPADCTDTLSGAQCRSSCHTPVTLWCRAGCGTQSLGIKGTKPMSARDRHTMFHERCTTTRGALPSALRFAVLLVAWAGASGCSDGPGADPDAGAVDTGVDGGVDLGVDGGVDASIDAASIDASMVDAGDLGAEADSGSADLGSDASSDLGVDQGALDQGPIACELVSGAPCEAPLRCTIVVDGLMQATHCAPAGAVQRFDACQRLSNGADDCGTGLVCVSGMCMAPCAVVDGVCDADSSCTLFAFGDDDALGFCTPTCNPVTQLRDADAMLCGTGGSPTACYVASAGPVCARESQPTSMQGASILGTAFSNSCAGGFRPVRYLPAASSECTAFCSPVETHSGAQGGVAGATPYACPDRGANAPHECRFSHWLSAVPQARDNLIGVCIDPTRMTYDHDADPDTARINVPSCTTLPNTDTDGDGVPQHVQFGCGPRPE